MNTRIIFLTAALLGSSLVSSMAHASPQTWTPNSGAAFRPADGSLALPQHVAGNVVNYDRTNAAVVEASLGRSGGVTQRFLAYGYNNGGNLTCTIGAVDQSGAQIQPLLFPVSTQVTGYFQMTIDTFTYTNPNPYYFYMIRCTLPAASGGGYASVFGVTAFSWVVNLLTPAASIAAFEPIDYAHPGTTREASLGHYGGGQIGFVVNGVLSLPNTLTCTVYAEPPAGGLIVGGSASTSTPGFVTMNVISNLPGGTDYFYTMRCTIPNGMDLRGVWPGK
jgi:hypothetical protein